VISRSVVTGPGLTLMTRILSRGGLFLDPYPRDAARRQAARGGGAARPILGDRRARHGRRPARPHDRLSTVNLGLGDYLRPAFGVYAVQVAGDGPDDPFAGRWIDGVANIGLRPIVAIRTTLHRLLKQDKVSPFS